jgi:hypothetical protein
MTEKKTTLRASSHYGIIQNDKQLLHEHLKFLNLFYCIDFIVMSYSLQVWPITEICIH